MKERWILRIEISIMRIGQKTGRRFFRTMNEDEAGEGWLKEKEKLILMRLGALWGVR